MSILPPPSLLGDLSHYACQFPDILQNAKHNLSDVFKFGSLDYYTGNQGITQLETFLPQNFQLDTRTNFPSDKLRKLSFIILLSMIKEL